MQLTVRTGAMSVACLLLGFAMLGCELSNDETTTADVTGSWLYSDTKGTQSTWALVQSSDDALSGAGTGGEIIHGSVSGDAIFMNLSYSSSSNSTAILRGTVTGSTMAGTFTNSLVGTGSWTAVKTN